MKIINGHGKIGKNGKYIVSPLDRKESKKHIKIMFEKVENILKEKFGKVIYSESQPKPYYWKTVEQAKGYLHTPSINIDSPNFRTNNQAFIHIDTGVNENGYNNEEVKRHFVISFELKGSIRYKYQKHWENDCVIIKKYILADNMVEALSEFENWLINNYDNFFTGRMQHNLSWRESR